MPEGCRAEVSLGQKVVAGETVLARRVPEARE